MEGRLFPLISTFGALASIISLFVVLWVSSELSLPWRIGPGVAFLLLTLTTVVGVLRLGPPTTVYKRENGADIRGYLFRWIKDGGRVVIWTRDMSWAEDEEVRAMLEQKAMARELIVCLPQNTELSDNLKKAGAEINEYRTSDAFSSRFTIVNHNQTGSRVAIATPVGNKHIIREFSERDAPTFQLARDLVELVRGQNKAAKQ